MELIKLIIDKKTVEVEKGTTIMQAAEEIGIHIPRLCYMNLGDFEHRKQAGWLPCLCG
jgi:NADP-reducing hydrogenase subunit HndD